MKNKVKNFFKLNNWKRWLILFFIFISCGTFIGTSFGLKSNESKVSNDYQNGVLLVVKPHENGEEIVDQTYIRQLLFNLKSRLENQYPDSYINAVLENENVFKIDITNINTEEQKDELLKFVLQKDSLTLTTINSKINSELYNSSFDNNFLFNYAEQSSNSYNLYMNSSDSKSFFNWASNQSNNGGKVIIWKNYEILKNIASEDSEYTNDQSLYEYLFIDGWTPEKEENKGENDTTRPPKFKEKFVTKDGKEYKATDFIVSKNSLSDFNGTTFVTVNKDFGSNNDDLTNEEINKEFYNVSYWISSISLNDSILVPISSNNGSNSFNFLLIALISFFAILSIFVVINYGYLGIFAILILATIIFLSLLMINVFFGDYDSISISAIILSALIVFDFITLFLESIKKDFLNGNSISKSIKNTIKNTKKELFVKSILLAFVISIFYAFVAVLYNGFSTIVLISALSIPFILIPFLILIANLMIGLDKMKNEPKLIGFWNSKYKNWKELNDSKINNAKDEMVGLDLKNNKSQNEKTKNWIDESKALKQKRFSIFNKYYGKPATISFSLICSFIFGFGIIALIVSFFSNEKVLSNSFNIIPNEKERVVLRIAKKDNSSFEKNQVIEIKSILEKNDFSLDDIKIHNSYLIEAYIDKDNFNQNINNAINQIYSLYNVVIIPSQLTSSNTYQIMQFSLYGILIAIIAMGIFVLIWTNWTKSLAIVCSSLLSLALFVSILLTGLIQISPLVSLLAILNLILFVIPSIHIINKINNKLKQTRFEELRTEEIKEIIYKAVFSCLKWIVISFIFTLGTFILFSILLGSLPLQISLFGIVSVIINYLISIVFLPKLLICLEIFKAKIRRKIILENYWDTEKIKEQTFNGINNIK